MEDLVLMSLFRPPAAPRAVSNVETEATHQSSTQTSSSLSDDVFEDAMERRIATPVDRPASPLSSLSHISLVRNQRNTLQSELRKQESATIEAKRSISSLRKLALRLAVRISVKEARIAAHARSLSQSRMSQYLAERTATKSVEPSLIQPGDLPLSPPHSPGPSKRLPSLPRWDSSGRVTTVRFSPDSVHDHIQTLRSPIASGQEGRGDAQRGLFEEHLKFEKIDASRASLITELETTQEKLRKLFESQAILRERYNEERRRAKELDVECQETHAKVFTLEQSQHEIEEEAENLHERICELEQGNERLRHEMANAKEERVILQQDLSKLQSSKLTLEHQLKAAAGSRDTFQFQLKGLQDKMAEKVAEMEAETKLTNATVAVMETERQQLEDELQVTKFRLTAAVDLESDLNAKLSCMRESESTLEQDLKVSRQTVAQYRMDLHVADERLKTMDQTVVRLVAQLQSSEQAKVGVEKAAQQAHESKEQTEVKLRGSLSKTSLRLRSARSKLFTSEVNKKRAETNLAMVQQSNDELRDLVEKTEGSLGAIVAKTDTSVQQLAKVGPENRQQIPDADDTRIKQKEESNEVEDQLLAHQQEIESLHQTNTELMKRLDEMTEELRELKEEKMASQTSPELLLQDDEPDLTDGYVASDQLQLEVQQLQETKAAFKDVVTSLQAKSAELELLEQWPDNPIDDLIPLPDIAVPQAQELREGLTVSDTGIEATGGMVNVHQPTVVSGHYAASEAGVVEIPSHSIRSSFVARPSPLIRKATSHEALVTRGVTSTADSSFSDSRDGGPKALQNHRRSVSEIVRPTRTTALHPQRVVESIYEGPLVELSVANLSKFNLAYQKELPMRPQFSETTIPQRRPLQKDLPSRPSFSVTSLSPRNIIDKELPALPRRPVGSHSLITKQELIEPPILKPKETKDDFEVGLKTWSLFPPSSKSMDVQRPATSSGGAPFPGRLNRGPVSTFAAVERRPGITRAVTESALDLNQEQMQAQESLTSGSPRLVRLKKSFSVLGNMSRKSRNTGSNQPPELRKKWSIRSMSSKLQRGRQTPVAVNDHPVSDGQLQQPQGRASVTTPVGLWDPVSKMWLVSQNQAGGIFDPESQQWLAPSPRIDSHTNVNPFDSIVQVIEETTEEDGEKDQDEEGTEHKMGFEDVDNEEDEELGTLSLAEKLEIIRYNPLARTFSETPDTTLRHELSSLTSSNDDVTTTHRPWKAGKVLGIPSPPKNDLMYEGAGEENKANFPDHIVHPNLHHARSSSDISGSGYMSFESDHEPRKKDWKGFWKAIKRTSNHRRSESTA